MNEFLFINSNCQEKLILSSSNFFFPYVEVDKAEGRLLSLLNGTASSWDKFLPTQ